MEQITLRGGPRYESFVSRFALSEGVRWGRSWTGVHENDLTPLVWMKSTVRSMVMEFFPEGFGRIPGEGDSHRWDAGDEDLARDSGGRGRRSIP